jgi:hypothetical protein
MMSTIRFLASLSVLSLMVFATGATAENVIQETTTTTTTTSTGTISKVSPEILFVKTATSPDPVGFSYTKTTTYVDENGKPVSIETVKSGLPVTVHYDKSGTKMVATKVVVKKTEVVPAS